MANPNLKENKFKRALVLPFRGVVKAISPTLFVKLQYKYITHHKLNLKNPVRYTEKLQYLRLFTYPKDPLVTKCASRDGVREYLKELGYENLLIPIYGIFDSFGEIDFSKLPDQFVLKCNHDNGVIICKDKSCFDLAAAKKLLAWHLQRDYYKKCREWPYKNVERKIICEKFMFNTNGENLLDYKLFCFNGVPEAR